MRASVPLDVRSAPPALLSFADVSKRVRDGALDLLVLDRISFDVQPGLAVGVYGARGSGKSTLLRLAAGIEAPDHGCVRFAGRDISAITAGERARLLRGPIALLAATAWTPCPGETVLDHVATSIGSDGLTLREARRRAHGALDRVGLAAASSERLTVSLPLAECARVMLARALVREPRLLVVDEPMPMPSRSERERFCALLRAVARERKAALLMASEEMATLQGLDTLMSLAGGELCSTEEPSAVVPLSRARAARRRP